MECTEVKVHAQSIKPREYRVCVFKTRWRLCIRLSGIRHLRLVFVNECLGVQFDSGIGGKVLWYANQISDCALVSPLLCFSKLL